MEPQTIKVGDFSPILGATVVDDDFTHIASVHEKRTACGKTPENLLLGSDFFLDCPKCLAEIQYRNDHSEAREDKFGVTHTT